MRWVKGSDYYITNGEFNIAKFWVHTRQAWVYSLYRIIPFKPSQLIKDFDNSNDAKNYFAENRITLSPPRVKPEPKEREPLGKDRQDKGFLL